MFVQLIGVHSNVLLKALHVRSTLKAELHACRLADRYQEPVVALCNTGDSYAALPQTASN
jgi:hypothetical protein